MPTRSGLDYHFIESCNFSVGDSVRLNDDPFYFRFYVVLAVTYHEDEWWVRVNRVSWTAPRGDAGLWMPEKHIRY